MKTLIIYISATGNKDRLAKTISAKSNDIDLSPITLKTKVPKSKFWVIFKFGFLMTFRKFFRYNIPTIDISRYDKIVIGTPVWAGKAAPPLIDVIKKLKVGHKVVGAFVTCGRGVGNVFDDICKRTSIVSIDHRLIITEFDDYNDPLVQDKVNDFFHRLISILIPPSQTLKYEL